MSVGHLPLVSIGIGLVLVPVFMAALPHIVWIAAVLAALIGAV